MRTTGIQAVLSVLLCAIWLVLLCPIGFAAETDVAVLDSGMISETVTWTVYDNGELVVDGTGAVPSYVSAAAPWQPYTQKITAITVTNGIVEIGKNAFRDCVRVTSVKVPFVGKSRDADTELESNFGYIFGYTEYEAFDGMCDVTQEPDMTFDHMYGYVYSSRDTNNNQWFMMYRWAERVNQSTPECTHKDLAAWYLKKQPASAYSTAYTPYQVVPLEGNWYSCFSGRLGTNVVLRTNAFHTPASLVDVTVTDAETIGNKAFCNNVNLKTICLNDGVTTIGDDAFRGCTALEQVWLCGDVESIGNEAFEGASAATLYAYSHPYIKNYCEKNGLGYVDAAQGATFLLTPPSKTTYAFGQALDLSGMSLCVVHADGTSREFQTGYTVTGYDAKVVGEQTITVIHRLFESTFCVTVQEWSLQGDVDGDGEITTSDARAILKYMVDDIVFDDRAMKAADMNGDGKVNAGDARAILIYMLNN